MFGMTKTQFHLALRDICQGVLDWRLWHLLAWQDVKQRYRRSTLGPIWATLSLSVQMIVMGFLFVYLFHSKFHRFFPYIGAGIVFWGLISTVIFEGANAFIGAAPYLTQVKRPFTTYVMQVVWRNVIFFCHNFVVYIIVAVMFSVMPSESIFLWPLAMALDLLCVSWIALLSGIISTRYRDVPMIIQNLFTALFWLTPVMYYPEQLGEQHFVVEYNPFTYMISLIRDPLLGRDPDLKTWIVVIGVTIVGWTMTFLMFARFRARITYWL